MTTQEQKTEAIRADECKHEIGRDAITHDGITHPSGAQKCLKCGETFEQILARDMRLLDWYGFNNCMSGIVFGDRRIY